MCKKEDRHDATMRNEDLESWELTMYARVVASASGFLIF